MRHITGITILNKNKLTVSKTKIVALQKIRTMKGFFACASHVVYVTIIKTTSLVDSTVAE